MINQDQLFEYLKNKIPNFQKVGRQGKIRFTCPKVDQHKFDKEPSVTPMPGSDKFYCLRCGLKVDIYGLVRLVEKKSNLTNEEVISFLTNEMKCDTYPELEYYQKMNWYLLPIVKNGKIPIKEFHWREESSNDKSKWINWLEQGLGLAVDCGKSNISAIDVDLKKSPTDKLEEVYKLLTASKTLTQNSPHGKHFIYVLDPEIPQSQKLEKIGLTIDTRCEGGYLIVSPTKIHSLNYNWVNLGSEIKTVTPEIKSKLLELLKVDLGRKTESPKIESSSESSIELINDDLSGCRNNTFISTGGALLKIGIIPEKIRIILHYLNKNWLKNPRSAHEIDAMMGSLEGYKQTEEHTQEEAIYEACKLIQTDISARDIIEHVFPGDKNKRAIVDKYLTKFHKEGKLSRLRRGRYDLKAKVEWTDEKRAIFPAYPYKIPYFDEKAYFHSGDIVIIGGKTGEGKTHIAMNIIKQMKDQGVKPYYIPLEAGSRYEKIADQLRLSTKDFYVSKDPIDNPLLIELESNAFTVIDWLYTGEDFAATQTIFKHLNDEMVRKGGILFVFTQLKEDYNYFAVNLIKSFARFSCRFMYDDDKQGLVSHFEIDKMTDPKGHNLTDRLDTEFNFDTKELKKR